MEFLKSLFRQLLGRTKTCEQRLNDQAERIDAIVTLQNQIVEDLKRLQSPQAVDLSAINTAIKELQERRVGLTAAQSMLLEQALSVRDDNTALAKRLSEIEGGLASLQDLANEDAVATDIPAVAQ
jgi:predicted nuclease with TOPRIM domain